MKSLWLEGENFDASPKCDIVALEYCTLALEYCLSLCRVYLCCAQLKLCWPFLQVPATRPDHKSPDMFSWSDKATAHVRPGLDLPGNGSRPQCHLEVLDLGPETWAGRPLVLDLHPLKVRR